MIRSTLKRTAIGFLIGSIVGNLIAIFASYASSGGMQIFSDELLSRVGSLATALLLQTLLSGLIGGVAWAGISLYELEKWSLLAAAAVHYVMIMAVYLPVALFLDWLSPSAADICMMSGIMLAAYLIVFLIMHAIYKREINRINKMLKAKENSRNTI